MINNMYSDEELVGKVKNSDDHAFRTLMDRYMKHVYNFVHQYIRTDDETEDVVQDAFYKTWKYIKRFKMGMKFKPWLFTIARNTALDHIKKKKAVPFRDMDSDNEETLSFEESIVDTEPLPSELFAQNELSKEFKNLLEILHPDHRAVITMHYEQEMTFEEIALIMDKPMNTVKSWHRRSLSKIREKILHRKPL